MKPITEDSIYNAPLINQDRISEDIGNLLVLAPHPDDESLGCGGLIATIAEAGCQVSVIFITSGTASHTSQTHPPAVLSKLRETEAKDACLNLGVKEANIHYLKAPDSELEQLDHTALTFLAGRIVDIHSKGKFSALAMPWRRDPHPDHRVVHSIGDMVIKSVSSGLLKFEYPVWLWKNGQPEDWPTVDEVTPYQLDITQVFSKKWSAIKNHASQLGEIISDDPNGFVLTDNLLEPFKSNSEYFFITERENALSLNKAYFDDLYAKQTDPWNFRNSDYEREKYKHAMRALGPDRYESGLELGCSIGIQTKLLAQQCEDLIAVDISKAAVYEASKNCADCTNVQFMVGNVIDEFPKGKFDLITCCEMGYYLAIEDLKILFQNIKEALKPGGKLLMVHWTPFVPDYPLSGDMVHNVFENYTNSSGCFDALVHERAEKYRLQVWQKHGL